MALEDLCKKCKEEIMECYGGGRFAPAWIHCHHPKEKPKCWCEESSRNIPKQIKIFGTWIPLEHCPQCGRKL
jgi:hypothetical protein